MRHLMLDLETLGTHPGCIILSIGAVEFDLDKRAITGRFHAHVDPQDAEDLGLRAEAGTVMWWLGQKQEAQQALLGAEQHGLAEVLNAFVDTFDWSDMKVWANGASFDFPILKRAFEVVGRDLPWHFYHEMDFRTVKNLVSKEDFDRVRVRPALAHDALEDTIAQAETLMNILALMKEEGGFRVAA